jgi:predicted membrane chloride channel (bestrophin family)
MPSAGLLLPEEVAWVIAQRHRPLAVGQALSSILQAVDADSVVKTRIDRLISTYTYEFGGCNRIYNTAIPSAYTRCVRVALCALQRMSLWAHKCTVVGGALRGYGRRVQHVHQ